MSRQVEASACRARTRSAIARIAPSVSVTARQLKLRAVAIDQSEPGHEPADGRRTALDAENEPVSLVKEQEEDEEDEEDEETAAEAQPERPPLIYRLAPYFAYVAFAVYL